MRLAAPRVRAAPDEAELARDAAAMTARLPSLALRTARQALAGEDRISPVPGPVLVQVPRRGYLAAIACGRCRAKARCAACGGPLEIGGSHQTPGCRWCGALAADWTCARCGSGRLRALVTGAARTAEELGRAFPGMPVRTSGGPHVIAAVPALRWRASFIARTTSGWGRPAESPITSVPPSMRPSRLSASCEGLATTSTRRSSSISRWRR